jgi:hypothetical protein
LVDTLLRFLANEDTFALIVGLYGAGVFAGLLQRIAPLSCIASRGRYSAPMNHLHAAIIYHLDELRDELHGAQLTDAARLAATARVHAEALRVLIDPTPEQEKVLEALAAAFEDIHVTVKRTGLPASHSRIRNAFDHASDRIDAAQSVLLIAKPSEGTAKRGL